MSGGLNWSGAYGRCLRLAATHEESQSVENGLLPAKLWAEKMVLDFDEGFPNIRNRPENSLGIIRPPVADT